jgi:hypothetical protein
MGRHTARGYGASLAATAQRCNLEAAENHDAADRNEYTRDKEGTD